MINRFIKKIFLWFMPELTLPFDKQFWEQVLEDYSKKKTSFICHTSSIFKREWHGPDREKIRNLAKHFILMHRTVPIMSLGVGEVLFIEVFDRKIRQEFLEWVIEQFNKNNENE